MGIWPLVFLGLFSFGLKFLVIALLHFVRPGHQGFQAVNVKPNSNKRNTEQAKAEILALFSEEPDENHEWTEQDIYEQSRKIIARWDKA